MPLIWLSKTRACEVDAQTGAILGELLWDPNRGEWRVFLEGEKEGTPTLPYASRGIVHKQATPPACPMAFRNPERRPTTLQGLGP